MVGSARVGAHLARLQRRERRQRPGLRVVDLQRHRVGCAVRGISGRAVPRRGRSRRGRSEGGRGVARAASPDGRRQGNRLRRSRRRPASPTRRWSSRSDPTEADPGTARAGSPRPPPPVCAAASETAATTPSRPAAFARAASRLASSGTEPTCLPHERPSSGASSEVSTVTATRRSAPEAASRAASSIAVPPAACTVRRWTPSRPRGPHRPRHRVRDVVELQVEEHALLAREQLSHHAGPLGRVELEPDLVEVGRLAEPLDERAARPPPRARRARRSPQPRATASTGEGATRSLPRGDAAPPPPARQPGAPAARAARGSAKDAVPSCTSDAPARA
jgi:hypothetical protein